MAVDEGMKTPNRDIYHSFYVPHEGQGARMGPVYATFHSDPERSMTKIDELFRIAFENHGLIGVVGLFLVLWIAWKCIPMLVLQEPEKKTKKKWTSNDISPKNKTSFSSVTQGNETRCERLTKSGGTAETKIVVDMLPPRIACPKCGVGVCPMADGTCPSCREVTFTCEASSED
jgi:hypothetical protein